MQVSRGLVSVVVPTHNGGEMLGRCLEGLLAQRYAPFEVIVVDNGSAEDIRGLVGARFPGARVVRLERNRGFAGGCNRGMEAARGEYVALINDDAVACPEWLGSMVAAAKADPSVGSVASVILDGNRPGLLDSCGVGIGLDGMSRQAMRGMPPPALRAPVEVLLPSGCACLYRMEALRQVGPFDEDFFAYCEDTDLGLRLRWAGWRSVAAPGAEVVHGYSMTGGRASLQKLFWVERNHWWVLVKDFPFPLWLLAPAATAWRYLVQVYVLAAGGSDLGEYLGEGGALGVLAQSARAWVSALAGAPRMLARRLDFVPARRASAAEMCRILRRFRLTTREIIGGVRSARH